MYLPLFATLQIQCFEGVFFVVCIKLYTSHKHLHFYNGALRIVHYVALGKEHFFELIVQFFYSVFR